MNDQLTGRDQELERMSDATLARYVSGVREELYSRWESWPMDLSESEKHEVIGALLARLVTLATQLAGAPQMWNGHVAPLILRAMTDAYITLAWIFGDPLARARQFIHYGLGQEKLCVEHLRQSRADDGSDSEALTKAIEAMEQWINAQRYMFLTEVNVGSWSGLHTRQMAEEADCMSLYRFAYTPFSCATHSMWNHIGKYNIKVCQNPLHRFHGIPADPELPTDFDFLYRAAKYADKGFQLFDAQTGVSVDTPRALTILVKDLQELARLAHVEQSVDAPAGSGGTP